MMNANEAKTISRKIRKEKVEQARLKRIEEVKKKIRDSVNDGRSYVDIFYNDMNDDLYNILLEAGYTVEEKNGGSGQVYCHNYQIGWS